MAKRIEELEQRAFEIEMDLFDVAYGDIPDRLRERTELIKAGHERLRARNPSLARDRGYAPAAPAAVRPPA